MREARWLVDLVVSQPEVAAFLVQVNPAGRVAFAGDQGRVGREAVALGAAAKGLRRLFFSRYPLHNLSSAPNPTAIGVSSHSATSLSEAG
jgi:hypothetical protein